MKTYVFYEGTPTSTLAPPPHSFSFMTRHKTLSLCLRHCHLVLANFVRFNPCPPISSVLSYQQLEDVYDTIGVRPRCEHLLARRSPLSGGVCHRSHQSECCCCFREILDSNFFLVYKNSSARPPSRSSAPMVSFWPLRNVSPRRLWRWPPRRRYRRSTSMSLVPAPALWPTRAPWSIGLVWRHWYVFYFVDCFFFN